MLHRQFIIVGATPQKRKRFAASAVDIAHRIGWTGREFLVGFETSVVGKLLDQSHSHSALAVAASGSILERLATASAVSQDYEDAIICYDWYMANPYFKTEDEGVLKAAEECFAPLTMFDALISCVPLDAIKPEEKEWLEEKSSLDIVDMSNSPSAFARLLLGW